MQWSRSNCYSGMIWRRYSKNTRGMFKGNDNIANLLVAQLVTHLCSTKITKDRSLAIALMVRDLHVCEYLLEQKKKCNDIKICS